MPFSLKTKGIFFFLFFILMGVVFFWYFYNLTPVNNNNVITLKFRTRPEEGIREIGSFLSTKGIIRSISVFKTYAVFSGKFSKIKPGIYSVSSSESIPQILEKLTSKPKSVILKIVPGSTINDIDRELFNKSLILKGELLNFDFKKSAYLKKKYPFILPLDSLEGLFYPDTYHLQDDFSVEKIVDKVLDNFNNKVLLKIESRESNDWYKNLIIASIVEKEVKKFKDKRLVAGILFKRLKLGMLLQTDATLVYEKCGRRFYTCPRDKLNLSKKDFLKDSPYNTYKNAGIPPTPICNPSGESLQAVYSFLPSSYLYYLTPSSSSVLYSKTLSEHNYKRQLYLK